MKTRRMVPLAALSILALTTVSLASCSSNSSDTGGGAKETITYLTHLATQAGPGQTLEKNLVAQFEKKHPNVTVKIIPVDSGSEPQKYQTMSAAGTPPDVYLAASDQVPQLLTRDALAPVDYSALGVSDISALKSKYTSRALTTYVQKDVAYGIPSEFSDYGTWVNTDVFRSAGVPVPTTWADVCAVGPKVLKKDSSGKVVREAVILPTNLSVSQLYFIDAVAREYGQPLFSADGKKAYLTSNAAVAAFQMVQDLVYKCDAAVPSINSGQVGADRIAYGTGVGGMMFTGGSWYLGTIEQNYPKLKPPVSVAMPYPSANGRTATTSYGYAWVVPTNSKHQKAAWEFIKLLQSAGPQYFSQIGLFNGTNSVADSAEAAKSPYWTQTWRPSLDSANYAVGLTNAAQIDDIVGGAFSSIILKKADVRSALQSAQSQITPLLNH